MEQSTVKSTLALHFPHRIFVGSLTRETTPAEIADFFKNFGVVIESKIILDSAGCSKGFGFVSFDSKEAVAKVLKQGTIYLKGRKITIAPAVKKHNVQESLPSDVRPTKYFTNKGSVKDIGFTNIRWPVPLTQHQQPVPQHQHPVPQQQQHTPQHQQHVLQHQQLVEHSQKIQQTQLMQPMQQSANFMNQSYQTLLPGAYNYGTVIPQWHVPPSPPSQGNWLAPYVFIY